MAKSLQDIINNRYELEESAIGRTYLSLKTDKEKLAFLEEASVSNISTEDRSYIFKCMTDFVSPLTKDDKPDHELFEKRIESLLERRFELRLQAGREIEEIMQSDLFDKSDEKFKERCILEGAETDNAAMKYTEIGALLNNDDMCRDFFEPYCAKYGKSVTETKLNDRMFATITQVGTQYEEKRLEECSQQERDRYALLDETKSIIPAKNAVEMTPADQARMEEKYNRVKKDNDNSYQDKVATAEVNGALEQFNTKRSLIFMGRETKEHKDLRLAAGTYQEKLKAYQEARKADPDKQLLAMKELEKAAEIMQEMADTYRKKKKESPNTPAGQDRLEGSIKLGKIAGDMKAQMQKEQEAMQAQNAPEIGPGRQSVANENGIVRKKTNVSELINLENEGKEKETHQRVSVTTDPQVQKTGSKHK